ELFYLDTANSDVSEALVVVNDKRSQWLKHKSKLSGLEKLGDQYEAELEQLDTLRGNEELDELSASRYIEAQHG
ncbi:MAG: hypothetical protein KTR35_16105, partial [Gammaproteobacteria bacterium]|nr:hypothetical protein [Gammaproteobacteria bacterium]